MTETSSPVSPAPSSTSISCPDASLAGARALTIYTRAIRRYLTRVLPVGSCDVVQDASRCPRSVMKNIACQLEHAVEAEVSSSFAWSWRTDINNWDDPPAQFQLDGPFASGSWGTTLLPGQEPVRWQIRDVRPGAGFIIEMPLDGAVLSFEWLFDAVSEQRTRITQRIVIAGDNAAAYVNQVQAGFGSNLPDGMKRIADAMVRAARAAER